MSINVLITGGAGFIGTNLIKRLLSEKGYNIWVIDNFSAGNSKYLSDHKNLTVWKGDLKNINILSDHINKFDIVVHLCGHTYVRESIKKPEFNFYENAVGTFNFLNSCSKAGVKHFIFASSGAVIGNHSPPFHEEIIAKPISPYGASKLVGEAYCKVFSEISSMRCTVLRFSNIFGPFSWHKTSVVAKFIKNILNNIELEVYGNGTQTRDYIYVDDICEALLKIFDTHYKYNIFHIGSGAEVSVNLLIDLLEKKFNRKIGRKYFNLITGEIIFNYFDISKANDELSFQPTVSIEFAIEKTIEWFIKWSKAQKIEPL